MIGYGERGGVEARNAKRGVVKKGMMKHLRAKVYSWIRLSWVFASATLVGIKQLINHSDDGFSHCSSKLCTIIGRASINSPVSPALDTSESAASFSVAGGAGATHMILLAKRLIIRSS